MEKPILSGFSPITLLNVQEYERYNPSAFSDSLTMLEKINKVIQNMIEIGTLSNEIVAKWNEVMEWVMNDGLNEAVIDRLNEMIADGTLGNLINQTLLVEIQNQLSDPRLYGAKGDGVTDDTTALQSWLNATAKSRVLRNGTFRITSGLTSSVAGRTIKSEGGTLLADTQDITVLTITGDFTKVSLDINGNNKAALGILISGSQGCEVKNSKIENLYGQFVGACGIKADTFKGVIIENNTIQNINALGNSTLGDNIGSSRAILVSNSVASMFLNVVRNNTITGITGEEGDAIQFLFYNGTTTPYLKAQGIIQGNTIKNCNRRAIKVQASDVRVLNNTHINTLLESDLPNSATLIDVIHSNDVVVEGNTIDALFFLGIAVNGPDTLVSNVVIKNNVIKGSLTTKTAIFLDNLKNSQVDNNVIYDGDKAIAMSNGANVTIRNNVLYGGNENSVGINSLANNSDVFIQNNVLPSGIRLYLIQNSAPNCIVENNHHHGDGACIRSYATAMGSVYRNNTNSSAATTLIGEFDDQYIVGGRNTGSGGAGTSDIAFSPSIPVSTIRHYNVGEVVFNSNPTAGGKVGWVCTGSGNPGTWKAFGVIDA